MDNEFAILDTLKVSDTVLFLISASGEFDKNSEVLDRWGLNILQACFGQVIFNYFSLSIFKLIHFKGLPTPIVAITDLETVAHKKRNEYKQNIQKFINKWLPEEKVMTLDKSTDGINIIRRIGNQKRRNVYYRDRRPHLYAEKVEYVPNDEGTEGTLKITGFLRGTQLSVNGLVHIPGLGDFQMSQIDAPIDPYSNDARR